MSTARVPPFTPPPDVRNVDPHRVLATLTATEKLDAAAQELAAALGVSTGSVRARVIPGGCTLCTTADNGGITELTGLDVAAAAAAAQSGDLIHLFVGQFVCVFSFDGARFAPQSCHITSF